MLNIPSGRRRGAVVVPLAALLGALAFPTSAVAEVETSVFFEETASAFWAVPHQCADGSTVQATLLVQSTRDFESPETEDADPTARVQYLAGCPNASVSWGRGAAPATITSTANLKSVTAAGSTLVNFLGVAHVVTFDVAWTGSGPLATSVNPNVSEGFAVNLSTRQQRAATATGRVTFDGVVLADGLNNHPTRPAPFIRNDEERTTRLPG